MLALFLVATGVAFVLRQSIALIFGSNSQKFDIDQIKTFEFLGAQIAQAQLAVLCCASVAITIIALLLRNQLLERICVHIQIIPL